jgi:hypothetical protein
MSSDLSDPNPTTVFYLLDKYRFEETFHSVPDTPFLMRLLISRDIDMAFMGLRIRAFKRLGSPCHGSTRLNCPLTLQTSPSTYLGVATGSNTSSDIRSAAEIDALFADIEASQACKDSFSVSPEDLDDFLADIEGEEGRRGAGEPHPSRRRRR